MERGHPLSVLIGMPGKNPHPYGTLIENRVELLEPVPEAVYKE
jgi:hypothetical protein